MIDKHHAILDLYPQVGSIIDLEAYDKEGNPVEIDLVLVEARVTEMQAEEEAKNAAAVEKLAKLGLTPEDLKALLG